MQINTAHQYRRALQAGVTLALTFYTIRPERVPDGPLLWALRRNGQLLARDRRKLPLLYLRARDYRRIYVESACCGATLESWERDRLQRKLCRYVLTRTMARDHGVLRALGYRKISRAILRHQH